MEWRLNGAQPKEPKAPRQAKAAIQQIHQLWAELRAQQLIGIALLARRAGDEFVSWGVKGGCKPQATSPKSKRAPPNFILLSQLIHSNEKQKKKTNGMRERVEFVCSLRLSGNELSWGLWGGAHLRSRQSIPE